MNTSSLSALLPASQNYFKTLLAEPREHQHGREKKAKEQPLENITADLYQPQRLQSEMVVESVVRSVQHSADIQIKTREGDMVTINLHQALNQNSTDFVAAQGNDRIAVYSDSQSYQSGFSYTVEGDLNAEEQESLADLINKISQVSDKFFKGNIQAAFKHAQKVGFDTEQIAGFTMDLNREHSVQAIAAYQQTMQPEQSINTDLLKQANEFLEQSKNFMQDSIDLLTAFEEPASLLSDLSSHIGKMKSQEELLQPLFVEMIENSTRDLFQP